MFMGVVTLEMRRMDSLTGINSENSIRLPSRFAHRRSLTCNAETFNQRGLARHVVT